MCAAVPTFGTSELAAGGIGPPAAAPVRWRSLRSSEVPASIALVCAHIQPLTPLAQTLSPRVMTRGRHWMKSRRIPVMCTRLLAAALLIATGSATPARAEVVRTAAVSYSDLDIGTAEGVRALDRRIRTIIAELCGTTLSVDYRGIADIRRCRVDAWRGYENSRAALLVRKEKGYLALGVRVGPSGRWRIEALSACGAGGRAAPIGCRPADG